MIVKWNSCVGSFWKWILPAVLFWQWFGCWKFRFLNSHVEWIRLFRDELFFFEMDAYNGYLLRLSAACNELLPRVQNQGYTVDAYFLESVVDRIFNDPQIDLLSVLPPLVSDFGEEYDQVIELLGTQSVVFKVFFIILFSRSVFL